MELVASDEVRTFVAEHGGAVYVRARSQRCCTGALTVLEASMVAPGDADAYERLEDPALAVYFRCAQARRPDQLVLKLKGRKHPKLAALWDGCAYAI